MALINGGTTLQFLSILPNKEDTLNEEDTLWDFYNLLRDTIVNEFRNTKLTPTKGDGHAAASGLYRVNTELSNLISDEDLATLLGKDCSLPLIVDELSRRRDERGRFVQDPNAQFIDNFLSTLRIPDWSMTQLISVLLARPEMIENWLRKKGVEDHQALYALLHDFLGLKWTGSYWYSPNSSLKNRVSGLPLVLCSDNIYRVGEKCFFPNDSVEHDDRFPRVVKGIYLSGENEDQQAKARGLLESFKVRPVDEVVEIEAILKQRYEDPYTIIPSELHEEDMKRFIALVEQDPDKVILFRDYRVFRTADRGSFDEGFYHKASIIFLDSPYLETGLKVYYEDDEYWEYVGTENIDPYLSLDYEESNIDLEELGRFAEALGAKTKLEVTKQTIPRDHPQFHYLRSAPGYRWTHTSIDEDYNIPEFPILLANPSIIKSKLVWEAMNSAPDDSLKSQFRWNQSYATHDADSTLVYELRKAKWVPQEDGDSISFVRPSNAVRNNLPGGFPYDTGQKWLETIEFGKTAKEQRLENIRKESEQNARNQRAKEFGFDSADEANTMAKIASELKEEGKTPDELLKQRLAQKRRKELLIIELEDAEEKEFETRARSIRSSRSRIEPKIALRVQYTTEENSMPCQICSKSMPFKKRNSDEDYFDAVEALGKGYFFKEHEAQYLALCPECAAEYTEYVKRDPKARETFYDALKNSDSPQIHLESHGRTIRIWFKDKHWQDLKTVLYYYENIYNPDESD